MWLAAIVAAGGLLIAGSSAATAQAPDPFKVWHATPGSGDWYNWLSIGVQTVKSATRA
jgi:hypothetical protein